MSIKLTRVSLFAAITLCLGSGSALADLKLSNNFYALDETATPPTFVNSNADMYADGAWVPVLYPIEFDNDLFDVTSTPPVGIPYPNNCPAGTTTTMWAGIFELGFYNEDTDGGVGFQNSRRWSILPCDKDRDFDWDAGDRSHQPPVWHKVEQLLPVPPNPWENLYDPDPLALLIYSPQLYVVDLQAVDLVGPGEIADPWLPFLVAAVTGNDPRTSFYLNVQDLDHQTACGTGNCAFEIVSTIFINLDSNCDTVPDRFVESRYIDGFPDTGPPYDLPPGFGPPDRNYCQPYPDANGIPYSGTYTPSATDIECGEEGMGAGVGRDFTDYVINPIDEPGQPSQWGKAKNGGLCFYAEAQKPDSTAPGYIAWSGNIQARLGAGGAGDKTVNYNALPTPVVISRFGTSIADGGLRVEWETASEMQTTGFYLERRWGDEDFLPVGDDMTPASLDAPHGAIYSVLDPGAVAGGSYEYRLVEVTHDGKEHVYGPFQVDPAQSSAVESQNLSETLSLGDTVVRVKGPSRKETERRAAAQKQGGAAAKLVSAVSKRGKIRDRIARLKDRIAGLTTSQGSVLKIGVTEPGLYYLGANEIAAHMGKSRTWVRAKIKRGGLELTNRGAAIAWHGDDMGAGLFFYGDGIESAYTSTNVYWLTAGSGAPMPIESPNQPSSTTGPGLTFTTTNGDDHEETWPLPHLFTEDANADFWFDDLVQKDSPYSPPEVTYDIATPGLDPDLGGHLRVELQGVNNLADGDDQSIAVEVNGEPIGTFNWDGQSAYVAEAEVPAGLFDDSGETTVKIVANGVKYSAAAINRVELGYERTYGAEDGILTFGAEDHQLITVQGFAADKIDVLDITDPTTPRLLAESSALVTSGTSGYAMTFTPSQDHRYIAVDQGAALTPEYVEADSPSDWRSADHNLGYLVITTRALAQGAQALADYRGGSVAYAEDIYDEFSAGIVDPQAFKNLLAYAYDNWQQVPDVVFAGKSTIDHKDRLGQGTSLMPTLMTATPYGLFASDNLFFDVAGDDGIPEIRGGRLPALSSAELQAYVDKVSAYEGSAAGGNALLVADNADSAGDFPANMDSLGTVLGDSGQQVTLVTEGSTSSKRDQVITALNQGTDLLNYDGHASVTSFGQEEFFSPDDLDDLTNSDRIPLFAAFACNIGNSSYPQQDSLSELMVLEQNKGAIAAFVPTGWSWDNWAQTLNTALVEALYTSDQPVQTLGEAWQHALSELAAAGGERFMLDGYSIVGDPELIPHR